MLDDFTNIVSKLKQAYHPSPWQAWAEQRQAARLAWYEAHTEKPEPKTPPERFEMTADEIKAVHVLAKCTYLPGSFEKRFACDMETSAASEAPKITTKQRTWLWKQVYRYRRQIGDKELLTIAEQINKENEAHV